MYKQVSNKVTFSDIEKDIMRLWDERKTFSESLKLRKEMPEFVFYDGPPFATGLPHYGHLLAGTIKDIVPRYQSMRGKYVERRFGWDCHGLPVEYEVEQDMKIDGKADIEKIGVDVFNENCRGIVLRYTREWRETVRRMGRWVDFENDYKTMDPKFMESIWWVFKSLWEKDLVYEGRKILPYCCRCSTPLSNFETNQGYSDVVDPAITIRFKLCGKENSYILAWTTTPWTLPSNMALAVGCDIDYAIVVDGDSTYYLAKERVGAYYKSKDDYDSISTVKGADLVGMTYEPLFDYFKGLSEKGAFRVISADFVSTEDGTGIVHMAPGFGEDDYRVGLENNLPAVCPVDDQGAFTAEVTDYAGRKVKDTDKDIIARLKKTGALVHRSTITHSYPHCWRCDTPLIYKSIATWFVRVEKIKDRIIEVNRQIHWVPEHLRDGRFGKWLEGARDWAISRNRYWGTPLPVWISEDGAERICVGSIRELEELTGQKITDLHKHYVDKLEIPSREGRGVLRRIPEVLDCWFESGSMPYAQAHYPFENKEHFEKHFPADFIAEGLDQTRGWFYTMMVLSVALFDKPAFKNVVVNGLILAEDGKKMSKRMKNYPDPQYMLDTYGADALRLYMIYSPVVRAESLRFSEEGVKQLTRHIMLPLWNSYSFFVTYANIDGWTTERMENGKTSPHVLDRWIRSSLESLIFDVTAAMDDYDLQRAVRPFVRFIEDLTNWYIRRSRRRFWKSQDDDDKLNAYRTLNYVLIQLSKVAAPFIPFVSESIYQNLRSDEMPASVHFCDFPAADGASRDEKLEAEMSSVMAVVKLGRLLRSEHDLKVRQPLSLLHVVCTDAHLLERMKTYSEIMREELNVKVVDFSTRESGFVKLKAKPDFSRLGPKYGKKMKKLADVVASLDSSVIETLDRTGSTKIDFDGESVDLVGEDIVIERIPRDGLVVAADRGIVVLLETELTSELIDEGMARDFVNRVQNMRKTLDLNVVQRITINCKADNEIRGAIENNLEYLKDETLCTDCVFCDETPGNSEDWEINGFHCSISVVANS